MYASANWMLIDLVICECWSSQTPQKCCRNSSSESELVVVDGGRMQCALCAVLCAVD